MKANTIFHGMKILIPMVINIRIGVVLDQASLKEDATAEKESKPIRVCSEDDVTKAALKWTLVLADNDIPFRFSNIFSGVPLWSSDSILDHRSLPPCSNPGVGISEGCFVFHFVSLPLEVAWPI